MVAPLAVLALVACSTPPPAQVLVVEPGDVYSGSTVDLAVAVVRAAALTGQVELSLVTGSAGITAAPVTTSTNGGTLSVVVEADVPAGGYPISVMAEDADSSVTSQSLTLTVLGPEPGGISGEVRSLLIPSPADGGFPAAIGGVFGSKSFVPGEDVPLAFDETRLVPGEIVVQLSDGVSSAQAAGSLTVAGVTLTRSAGADGAPGQVWTFDAALDVEQTVALARRVAARPDVAYATPNWLFTVHATPLLYPYQWHYPAIDLHGGWTVETGEGADVVVAVVDSGYQAHVDLAGVFLPGYDFVNGDADATDTPSDGFSHGTHVSGTIASDLANDPLVAGVSRGARILPVKVLDDDGVGTFDGIIAGMVWATGLNVPGYTLPGGTPANPNPARILNMSLGGRVGACPAQMADIISYLASQGVVIVVSAGNSSQDTAMFAPANCPDVITVAASGPFDERAYYSNFGSDVDIIAPGGNFDVDYAIEQNLLPDVVPAGVLSTVGALGDSDYFWSQGTSMAAPHVTGVVALLLAADPAMTLDQVRAALTDSARPMPAWKCDRPSAAECGAGHLDAAAALGAPASGPWVGAPTVESSLYSCLDASCGEIDGASVPLRTADAVLTRAYSNVSFDDLPPGFYLLSFSILAPGTDVPSQAGSEVVEVLSGAQQTVVVYAFPDVP